MTFGLNISINQELFLQPLQIAYKQKYLSYLGVCQIPHEYFEVERE
jgi:hypothetical protein